MPNILQKLLQLFGREITRISEITFGQSIDFTLVSLFIRNNSAGKLKFRHRPAYTALKYHFIGGIFPTCLCLFTPQYDATATKIIDGMYKQNLRYRQLNVYSPCICFAVYADPICSSVHAEGAHLYAPWTYIHI